ncbi:MAG TPA: TonB-dependent receptor plug domain-containing protein, partial [Bacteroidales bacterium]|nr:TonB-dependent receptor plug domain-containing protein [Bacteroidales bacterium]
MLKINCLYLKPAGRLLLLVLFSACVKGTFAQSPFKADLKEVKVYSTRVDQLTNETGRDITIISHNEIRQLPVDSPEELLRYLPGMVVQSRNGFGVQSDISMRGSTFSQVLVLIDGMRLNDPLTAHFNGYLPVSLSEIDRIEIIRGPATAMYGSDAVGGVINIITKTFSGDDKQPSVADGRLSYGQHNLISGDAGGFLNGKKLKLGGGLMVNQSDGQALPSGENADFILKTASLSGTYQFSPHWKASLRSAYDYRNFNARYFYTRSPYDESREQVNTSWNQLQISHAGRLSSTSFNLAYKTTRDSFLFNPAFTASVHQTKFLNGQLNHTINFKQNLKLGLGAQTDLRTIKSNDRGDHQDKHVGTYTVLFFKPAASVNLTGSLRGDYDDNFGFELLPQVSGSWELQKWTFRASVGRSI